MKTWHFIEGEAGCAFAVEQQCAALVVDSLRASATAAMLLGLTRFCLASGAGFHRKDLTMGTVRGIPKPRETGA